MCERFPCCPECSVFFPDRISLEHRVLICSSVALQCFAWVLCVSSHGAHAWPLPQNQACVICTDIVSVTLTCVLGTERTGMLLDWTWDARDRTLFPSPISPISSLTQAKELASL